MRDRCRQRLEFLDRATERSFLTALWRYVHRFLLRDSVDFRSSDEIASMLDQAGFQDVRVVARLRRLVWKSKLYTSLALIRGTKPECAHTA